jgi:hypothetical protein
MAFNVLIHIIGLIIALCSKGAFIFPTYSLSLSDGPYNSFYGVSFWLYLVATILLMIAMCAMVAGRSRMNGPPHPPGAAPYGKPYPPPPGPNYRDSRAPISPNREDAIVVEEEFVRETRPYPPYPPARCNKNLDVTQFKN